MKKWNTKQILESLDMHPVGGIGRAASAELRRLHEVKQELLDACYAVLHDCDDIDMVESNEPGREKGPWQMLNEAIAKAVQS